MKGPRNLGRSAPYQEIFVPRTPVDLRADRVAVLDAFLAAAMVS